MPAAFPFSYSQCILMCQGLSLQIEQCTTHINSLRQSQIPDIHTSRFLIDFYHRRIKSIRDVLEKITLQMGVQETENKKQSALLS